jgi:hypothetical protein
MGGKHGANISVQIIVVKAFCMEEIELIQNTIKLNLKKKSLSHLMKDLVQSSHLEQVWSQT